jgi:hypothetical protein
MSLLDRHLVEEDDQYASEDDQFDRLEEVKVTLSPKRSPDHLARLVVSSSSARITKRTKRKKPQASASDAYLLMNMEPNRPDIYRQAATKALDVQSVSGDESMPDADEIEEEDLDTMVARQMAEKEAEDAKVNQEAAKERLHAQRRQEWEKQKAADEERDEQERQAESERRRQGREEAEEKQRRGDEEKQRAERERLELKKTAQLATEQMAALAHSSPAYSEDHKVPPTEGRIRPEPPQGGGLCITVPDRSKDHNVTHPPIFNGLQTPLEPRRMSLSYQHQNDSLQGSPLSAHLKQGHSEDQKLPALQSHGTTDGPGSPQSGKLPGFATIAQVAEKANGEISRQRQHSLSMASPYSVRSPYTFTHPSPAPSETSPRSGLPMGMTSPQGIPVSFFSNRRPSAAGDYPHGLPSASSTDNSYASASTDGYSPGTNPTPQSDASHRLSNDGTITEGRPILPPPVPSLQSLAITTVPPHGSPAGFTCDFPGCTAQAFQTQYLLK